MVEIRCPGCRRMFQPPAVNCPYCGVDLKDAALPKKRKPPLVRGLVSLVVILLCAAVVYFLAQKLLKDGAFDAFKKKSAQATVSVVPGPLGS